MAACPVPASRAVDAVCDPRRQSSACVFRSLLAWFWFSLRVFCASQMSLKQAIDAVYAKNESLQAQVRAGFRLSDLVWNVLALGVLDHV